MWIDITPTFIKLIVGSIVDQNGHLMLLVTTKFRNNQKTFMKKVMETHELYDYEYFLKYKKDLTEEQYLEMLGDILAEVLQ